MMVVMHKVACEEVEGIYALVATGDLVGLELEEISSEGMVVGSLGRNAWEEFVVVEIV